MSKKDFVGMSQCYYCLEPSEVLLHRRLRKVIPRLACYNKRPCTKCEEHMKLGIILISVDEKLSTDKDNPYRTGGWVVIKEDAIRRMVNPPELAEQIIGCRMAFVPDEVWDMLRLPRGDSKGAMPRTAAEEVV